MMKNFPSKKRGKTVKKTGMVSRSLLDDAVSLLPKLPDTTDFLKIKKFIINNLGYNSEYSRKRYQRYITVYLFPNRVVDKAILQFSKKVNELSIKNVCLYRFCKAYPLIFDIFSDLLIPNISQGCISRNKLDDYLQERFPESAIGKDGSRGFLEALIDSDVIQYKNGKIVYTYRQVDPLSFAFILHSEFSVPGMYDISLVEKNRVFVPQLWHTNDLLEALYILRNRGILPKISEIDTVRQFTTKYSLDEFVWNI